MSHIIIETIVILIVPIITRIVQDMRPKEVIGIFTIIIHSLSRLFRNNPSCIIFITQPWGRKRCGKVCSTTGTSRHILTMPGIRQTTCHFPPVEQFGTQVRTERITFVILAVSISLIIQIPTGEEISSLPVSCLSADIHTIILAQFSGEDSLINIPVIFIPYIFQRITITVMQYVVFIDMSERSHINSFPF